MPVIDHTRKTATEAASLPPPSCKRTRIDRDAARDAALQDAEVLFVHAWGVPQSRRGKNWRAKSNSAQSMEMRGIKRGQWYNHKTGRGGDIFDFVAVHFLGLDTARSGFPAVLREVQRLCGGVLSRTSGEVFRPTDAERDLKRRAQREEAREAAQRTKLIEDIQENIRPLADTPGARYLDARCLAKVPPLNFGGFLPANAVPDLPCSNYASIVTWARDAAGEISGGQRILLKADGTAPTKPNCRKYSFGKKRGSVATLPGSNDSGPLVVAEGPETALAIWSATGFETWSVIDVGGFKGAPIPRDRTVFFAPDRDAPESPARTTFDKAVQHHRETGCDITVVEPPEPAGSKRDFNDTLIRAGAKAVAICFQSTLEKPRDRRGRFTGPSSMPAPGNHRVDNKYIDSALATEQIRKVVRSFLENAQRFVRGTDTAPATVIAASPGAGKSRITYDEIAKLDLDALGGDVVFYVPTLALADDTRRGLQRLGVKASVLRGRSATDPQAGLPMCRRADLADALAEAGGSVGSQMCKACPFSDACPYRAQWSDLPEGPVIRIQTHAALAGPNPDRDRPTALRIVDETFWPSFVGSVSISRHDLCQPNRRDLRNPTESEQSSLDRADTILQSLLDASPTGSLQIPPGLTSEDCLIHARIEEKLARPHIRLGSSDESNIRRMRSTEKARESAATRVRLWQILAEAVTQGLACTERVRIDAVQLRVHWRTSPPQDAPALVLDANATPEIIAQFFRVRHFANPRIKPNAEILQIEGETFSKKALQSETKRREVIALVRDEVVRDRKRPGGPKGVLVVASKEICRLFLEDASGRQASHKDLAPGMQMFGASWIWFGSASVGRNDWRDFGTAVVLGREELPLSELQNLARGLFGDGGDGLDFLSEAKGSNLPELPLLMEMSDGTGRTIMARSHPDRRIRAIQMQYREMGTLQTVERLRLAHAISPKRVILCSKIPIPGLPVTSLLKWRELVPSWLTQAMNEVLCRGCSSLRLSAKGLAADAPETFRSESAAISWLARDGQDQIKHLRAGNEEDMSGAKGYNFGFVKLRIAGQRGKPTPAIILSEGNPETIVRTDFGPGTKIERFDDPPAPEPQDVASPDTPAPAPAEVPLKTRPRERPGATVIARHIPIARTRMSGRISRYSPPVPAQSADELLLARARGPPA